MPSMRAGNPSLISFRTGFSLQTSSKRSFAAWPKTSSGTCSPMRRGIRAVGQDPEDTENAAGATAPVGRKHPALRLEARGGRRRSGSSWRRSGSSLPSDQCRPAPRWRGSPPPRASSPPGPWADQVEFHRAGAKDSARRTRDSICPRFRRMTVMIPGDECRHRPGSGCPQGLRKRAFHPRTTRGLAVRSVEAHRNEGILAGSYEPGELGCAQDPVGLHGEAQILGLDEFDDLTDAWMEQRLAPGQFDRP